MLPQENAPVFVQAIHVAVKVYVRKRLVSLGTSDFNFVLVIAFNNSLICLPGSIKY